MGDHCEVCGAPEDGTSEFCQECGEALVDKLTPDEDLTFTAEQKADLVDVVGYALQQARQAGETAIAERYVPLYIKVQKLPTEASKARRMLTAVVPNGLQDGVYLFENAEQAALFAAEFDDPLVDETSPFDEQQARELIDQHHEGI